ncbi:MAG: hypothetical protein K2K89_11360 [Ruminococcus sp.]|nr:hypothetical protein [Ruminococcus sp.]
MRTSKWFSHYQYNDEAEYNLFCFVHAGGSSGYYSNWKKYFDKNFNIIPVEYPMRERRFAEPMPETIRELAEDLVEENRDFFTDKKFAFWGHCTGGLVALETAEYLEKKYSVSPDFLFISSLAAPEFSQVPDVSGMSDRTFADFAVKSGFVAKELCENEELLQYFLPIARADFAMHHNYIHESGVKVNAPVILFNGKEDSIQMSEEQIEAWENYTHKPVKEHYFSGNHFYINEHLPEVCEILKNYLRQGAENLE